VRVLALDIGERRVGVAASDAEGRVALPLAVLDSSVLRGDMREIVSLARERRSELVVVGLPLTMDGTEGPQAQLVREAGERLARFLPIPIVYTDERLSSAQASRAAQEAGVSDRDQRGRLDDAAAAVFLQQWLDANRTENE